MLKINKTGLIDKMNNRFLQKNGISIIKYLKKKKF